MADKIDPYDLLAKLVLGILLLCAIPIGFPIITTTATPTYPSTFLTLALTALALVAGELLQALSSVLEGALFWSFGGKPSDYVLDNGVGRISKTSALRIRSKLIMLLGDVPSKDLFNYARQMAQTTGRAPRFNAQYGYHRGLYFLVLLIFIIFLTSTQWGAATALSARVIWIITGFYLLLMALVWKRTKQWAFYYVEEIILTTEQIIDKNITMSKQEDRTVKPEATAEENDGEDSNDDKLEDTAMDTSDSEAE